MLDLNDDLTDFVTLARGRHVLNLKVREQHEMEHIARCVQVVKVVQRYRLRLSIYFVSTQPASFVSERTPHVILICCQIHILCLKKSYATLRERESDSDAAGSLLLIVM